MDKKVFNKVLIIDGSYLLHRQLNIGSLSFLKNSKGEDTGGIFGFLRALNKEITICGDYFPVVCFDEGLSKRRVQADPKYKKADERDDKNNSVIIKEDAHDEYIARYRSQRNRLVQILAHYGIPSLKFKGVEGDDIIYVLSKLSNDSLILTDDRDMLQLLSPTCRVRRPMKDEMCTIDSFIESKGYENIYQFVVEKAVMGDGSDNIPSSCKGVGKTFICDFVKLLCTFNNNFEQWNFDGYPTTESDMKNYCKSYDLRYRKAYLNLDFSRFFTNLELVDLDKVDLDEETIESIIATVSNCRAQVDYFKAVSQMSELEIREFSVDELMEKSSKRYPNLMIQ